MAKPPRQRLALDALRAAAIISHAPTQGAFLSLFDTSCRFVRAWAWAGGTLCKPPTSEAAHRGGAAYDRGNGGRRGRRPGRALPLVRRGEQGRSREAGEEQGLGPARGHRLTRLFRGHPGQKGERPMHSPLFIYICLIMQRKRQLTL